MEAGIAAADSALRREGALGGRACSSACSPYQRCGVALVRMETPEHGPGTRLDLACKDGASRPGALCETPMYDKERFIPRGGVLDVPARTR